MNKYNTNFEPLYIIKKVIKKNKSDELYDKFIDYVNI